jgi:AcrR family transcriptional regulator
MTSDIKEENSLDLKEELLKFGETQRRILEAAISVFAEKGFEGGRIDEIARRSKVNKAMIYYYFDSKEKLYTKIIEIVFKKVSAIIIEHFSDMNPDTLKESIKSFIERYIDFIYTNLDVIKVLFWELARGGEIIGDVIKREVGGHFVHMIKGFNAAVEAGKLRPMDPRHMFMNIIGMVLFYFVANRVFSVMWNEDALSPENIEMRKKEVTDFVIRAIVD